MEGHVNTPSEILQSPKDLCRKKTGPRGGADHFQIRPQAGAQAADTSAKTIAYSSFRHDKGDVDMHSPYNKMPSHFNTQPISQAPVNISVIALAEFALKAAQQAHDRGLPHTKAAGAQHLDLESMD